MSTYYGHPRLDDGGGVETEPVFDHRGRRVGMRLVRHLCKVVANETCPAILRCAERCERYESEQNRERTENGK